MKRYSSFLVCFLLCFELFSQTIPIGFYAMPEKNFLPGITFSPDYTFRSLVLNDNTYKWVYDQRESSEHPYFGYTTGLNFKYKLGRKAYVGGGLQIASYGFKTDEFNLQESPYDPETPVKASYKYRYNYVHLPFTYSFYKARHKFQGWMFTVGTYGNFAMNGKTRSSFVYSDGSEEKEKTTMAGLPSHLGISAGIGYEFKSFLSHMRIEPVFRRSLLVFKQTPVKTHFYSFGINLIMLLNP